MLRVGVRRDGGGGHEVEINTQEERKSVRIHERSQKQK